MKLYPGRIHGRGIWKFTMQQTHAFGIGEQPQSRSWAALPFFLSAFRGEPTPDPTGEPSKMNIGRVISLKPRRADARRSAHA